MAHRRALALLAAAVVILAAWALGPPFGVRPASANHIAGATYTGTHSAGGGTVTFTVSGDGSGITSFSATDVPGDFCDFPEIKLNFGTPLKINDHAFKRNVASGLSISGTFPGVGTAQGTLRNVVSGVCDTGTVNWTAETDVAASPTSTPTPTNTPPSAATATPTNTSPGPTPTPTPTVPDGECVDDAFEDNDTPDTPSVIALPFSQSGLRSCPADIDTYEFLLFAGESVQIEALFSDAQGDIDIHAYDPDGLFIADSISITDNEKITFVADQTGAYQLDVVMFQDAGAPGNTYTLDISLSEVLFGDTNCDGSVNSIDATLILQLVAGLLGSLNCEAGADVNLSGDVNSIDATILLQFVAGLLNGLPV